jgi:alpha-D-ribose 1-methylphosphonate 5-triphosphate synthase subunit PhnG
MTADRDYILCECPLERLMALVEELEQRYEIKVTKSPSICLTMLKAQDSVEEQAFYLGEALTSDCEVVILGVTGYGVVLEDQPQRAYCLAVVDALAKIQDSSWPLIAAFLEREWAILEQLEKEEFTKIMQSAVDFKLMEEA